MAKYIITDNNNRVVGFASGSYTDESAPTGMFRCDSFTRSDLFKIYDVENDTFTADSQTEYLLTPPQPQDDET